MSPPASASTVSAADATVLADRFDQGNDRAAAAAMRVLRREVGSVRIEVLYFDGCPNHEALSARLRELLAGEGIATEIELRAITDGHAAQRERFLGSPTIRVNGRDVEPDAEKRTDSGIKCRLYRTAGGVSGQPADEWLHAAIGGGAGAAA